MPDDFDPYRKWLGIPKKDQPPHYYRLLNIEPFESDPDVICNAADARMGQIKQYQSGKHSEASQHILNEISTAKVCLLNQEKKADYDAGLRQRIAPPTEPEAPPLAAPPLADATHPADHVFGGPPIAVESPSVAAHVVQKSERSQKQRLNFVLVGASAAVAVLIGLGILQFIQSAGTDVAEGPAPSASADTPRAEPAAQPGESRNPAASGRRSHDAARDERSRGPDDAGHARRRHHPGRDSAGPGEVPTAQNGSTGRHGSPDGPTAQATPAKEPTQTALQVKPDKLISELFGSDEPRRELGDLMNQARPAQAEPQSSELQPGESQGRRPHEAEPQPARTASQRLPVPDQATQDKIKGEVEEIFKAELAAATTSEKKAAMAQKLRAQAEATNGDPNARFVLLRMACNLAAEGGNVEGAMETVDAMRQFYEINAASIQTYVLSTAVDAMPNGSLGVVPGQQIVDAALALADKSIGGDQYDVANGFANLALGAARKTKDASLIQPVAVRSRQIGLMKSQFESIRKALDVLAASAHDPEANLTAGRWFCLEKGAWAKGLPMLAKGSDPGLAKAAGLEMAGSTNPDSQVAVGDAWWDQAERESDDAQRALQSRARFWYQQALPSLAGLNKVKVQKRLEASAETAASKEKEGGDGKKTSPVRAVIQPGNVALASNGTTVTGVSSGGSLLLDGSTTSGYAYSSYPCEWTITFDKVYRLQGISFLLNGPPASQRYFRYGVAISADGQNYVPLADCSKGQWRGWQRIRIPNRSVKSIRLFGLYHSDSSYFSVCEFEAYCVVR